jgi:F-type H+-transporting ATPase subunit b
VEANWTTFLLEAVNFLVLVWILKHFLYKPILGVIERRRAAIEQALEEARNRQADAEALEGQAQDRLEALDRERQAARDALDKEIAAERQRRMDELLAGLEAERERARVLSERRTADEERRREERAVAAGVAFTAKLLGRVAGPEVEGRLVDMAVEDLKALPPERAADIREAVPAGTAAVVTTSLALSDGRRKALTGALEALVPGAALTWEFQEDPQVVAGVRVSLGPWVLKASLADELEFFAGGAPD